MIRVWSRDQLSIVDAKWRFPGDGDGTVFGLNDAGIETFKNLPVESLTRETIQNSLDAADINSEHPVEVHFFRAELPVEQFPLMDDFKGILEACRVDWTDSKTIDFFNNALGLSEQATMPFLVIRDYNTTGLLGSHEERNSCWANLIKCIGVSQKPTGAGGSFGLGKHAPFACSALRTVFYSTVDKDGRQAFQGKSILVTHRNAQGDSEQATGYFGHARNTPLRDATVDIIPDFFRRERVGTDLFVAGFTGRSDWQQDIINAVLDHFLVAIHEGRLVVRVQDTELKADTITGHLEQRRQRSPKHATVHYYDALTSESSITRHETDFMGLGEIELHLIQGKDCPRKIAMVRSTGMKVFDKGRFHTPLLYAGILIAKGEGINQMLRACEPPSHDQWIAERHEDPVEAKRVLKSLYNWVKEQLNAMAPPEQADEVDAVGMSQYLPDDPSEVETTRDTDRSYGEKSEPADVELRTVNSPQTRRRAADETLDAGGMADGEGGEETTSEPGEHNGGHSTSGKGDHGNGTGQERRPSEEHGSPSQSGGQRTLRLTALKSRRFIRIDEDRNTYRVAFRPASNVEDGILALTVCGDGDDEKAPIQEAVMTTSREPLQVRGDGRIRVTQLLADDLVMVDVTFGCSELCAVEVALYE